MREKISVFVSTDVFPSQPFRDGTPVCTAESFDSGLKTNYRHSHVNKNQISEGVLSTVEGVKVLLSRESTRICVIMCMVQKNPTKTSMKFL